MGWRRARCVSMVRDDNMMPPLGNCSSLPQDIHLAAQREDAVTLEVRGAPPTTVVWEKWGQKGQVVSRVPRCSNSFLLHDVNHTPHIFNCAPTHLPCLLAHLYPRNGSHHLLHVSGVPLRQARTNTACSCAILTQELDEHSITASHHHMSSAHTHSHAHAVTVHASATRTHAGQREGAAGKEG